MKTLVVVHPGSLFGSADFSVGKRAAWECRSRIMEEIARHQGNLIVIDGFLSDEISDEFEDVIYTGLSNAITCANRTGKLGTFTALRVWGCDGGERPFEGWHGFGSCTQPMVFSGQEEAAEYISSYLTSNEIVVTGAWATEHGEWGCVNSVADVFRSRLPNASVRVSEDALFEGSGTKSSSLNM